MTTESNPSETRDLGGRKFGLKLVLTCLILAAVGLTAGFIHLLWSNGARENVGDVAGQLNEQIVGSI